MNRAVLLVNLGSPDSPSVADVRRYLREFLMDARVLDVNWFLRFCIVHFGILPSRPAQSAEAYRQVWTAAGSPLIAISRNLQSKLQQRVTIPVELAMRYQHPSISGALVRLAERGIEELLLVPLFPHYAMSSYETAVERVRSLAARSAAGMRIQVQPPCFDHPDYIAALVGSAKPFLNRGFDHLLFSYHGLPERHLRKSDTTRGHCLATADCCQVASPAHATCYRAQCIKTTAAFVRLAGIPAERHSVAFQSRLGRDPWLKPYTDHELVALPARGVKRLLVICPAFVSDCLETLEEIGLRGKRTFLEAGGEHFALIPCLNDHPMWLEAVDKMVERFMKS